MLIITSKNKHRHMGSTRSQIETNLKKDWGSSSLTEEQIDKCKYLEKKIGLTKGMIDTGVIDRVK